MPASSPSVEVEIDDRVVRISNPDRVYFPARGETKLDLVEYYLAVSEGIVRALYERPCMLHRFPEGVSGEKVHQKRVPRGAPPWLETVRLHFPRYDRYADELCVTEPAAVIWAVQMSTVEFHPWNSRRADTESPTSGASTSTPVRRATTHACAGSPTSSTRCSTSSERWAGPRPAAAAASTSTCGSRPTHGFPDVRRAALAFAREVERRAPDEVTTTWWRKDRDPADLFVDYNQNTRDHTIAAAYSVRGNPEGDRLGPDPVGRGRRRRARRLHDRDGARRGSPSSATCTPASTRPSSTSPRCWSGPTATRRPDDDRGRPPLPVLRGLLRRRCLEPSPLGISVSRTCDGGCR